MEDPCSPPFLHLGAHMIVLGAHVSHKWGCWNMEGIQPLACPINPNLQSPPWLILKRWDKSNVPFKVDFCFKMESICARAWQNLTKNLFKCHDIPIGGHSSLQRPFSFIQRFFYWPRMRVSIESYVKKCKQCQVTKDECFKKASFLHLLANVKWQIISMDSIASFPCTNRGNDTI